MTSPLIVIVGPTASGKTGLSVDLAKQFGGEIISADSRAIYKGMDIGTAKPTMDERNGVPHWGFDLVEPGQPFSVADFKRYADQKIAQIRARGNVPFLVGGTGLYVDAVVFNYQFGPQSDPTRRQELESMTLNELYKYCSKHNVNLPENDKNKRYVVRAIEQHGLKNSGDRMPASTSVIVGIATDRGILRQRITDRTEQLFQDGVVDEATMLGEKYGWDSEAMTGNIYPLVHQHLLGSMTHEQMKEKFTTLDWRLAKRQMTWLRRNEYIVWCSLAEAREYLVGVLANEH
ncbi:MAG: tRNA (adenosine(37)-N6)-dimethylallyltransferase MiaA [Candidatus Saccharimonadales bacterium]